MEKIILAILLLMNSACSLIGGGYVDSSASPSNDPNDFMYDNFFELDMKNQDPDEVYAGQPIDYSEIMAEYDSLTAPQDLGFDMNQTVSGFEMSLPPSQTEGYSNSMVSGGDQIFDGDSYQLSPLMTFSAGSSQSLKEKLYHFLIQGGYKLIWNSEYDIFFGNDVMYQGDDIFSVLKSIAKDLEKSGVDLHINVYIKNKVVLVYSMRS